MWPPGLSRLSPRQLNGAPGSPLWREETFPPGGSFFVRGHWPLLAVGGLSPLFMCLVVEMLNCLSSQRTTDKQLNRPEASTPNNDHVPGVGAYCIRPTDVPAGTGSGYIYSAPRGPSNGGECNSPLHTGTRQTSQPRQRPPLHVPGKLRRGPQAPRQTPGSSAATRGACR